MNPLRYRPAWRWHYSTSQFMSSHAHGFTVHLFNGHSKLGNLRIDKFSPETDLTADACFLPLKDESVDTVLADPPWTMDNTIKGLFVSEIRRVLRPGGSLYLVAPWSPKMPGLRIERIYVPEAQLMRWKHVHLIFHARKVKYRMFPLPDLYKHSKGQTPTANGPKRRGPSRSGAGRGVPC